MASQPLGSWEQCLEGLLLRQFGDWGQVPMKNHDLSRSLVSHYLSFLPCVMTLALSLFEKLALVVICHVPLLSNLHLGIAEMSFLLNMKVAPVCLHTNQRLLLLVLSPRNLPSSG